MSDQAKPDESYLWDLLSQLAVEEQLALEGQSQSDLRKLLDMKSKVLGYIMNPNAGLNVVWEIVAMHDFPTQMGTALQSQNTEAITQILSGLGKWLKFIDPEMEFALPEIPIDLDDREESQEDETLITDTSVTFEVRALTDVQRASLTHVLGLTGEIYTVFRQIAEAAWSDEWATADNDQKHVLRNRASSAIVRAVDKVREVTKLVYGQEPFGKEDVPMADKTFYDLFFEKFSTEQEASDALANALVFGRSATSLDPTKSVKKRKAKQNRHTTTALPTHWSPPKDLQSISVHLRTLRIPDTQSKWISLLEEQTHNRFGWTRLRYNALVEMERTLVRDTMSGLTTKVHTFLTDLGVENLNQVPVILPEDVLALLPSKAQGLFTEEWRTILRLIAGQDLINGFNDKNNDLAPFDPLTKPRHIGGPSYPSMFADSWVAELYERGDRLAKSAEELVRKICGTQNIEIADWNHDDVLQELKGQVAEVMSWMQEFFSYEDSIIPTYESDAVKAFTVHPYCYNGSARTYVANFFHLFGGHHKDEVDVILDPTQSNPPKFTA